MAAPIGVDRVLAAEVRRMTLEKIKKLFSMGVSEMSERELNLHDAVLQKLAGTVLPRLQEVTGENGDSLQVTITGAKFILDNGTGVQNTEPEAVPSS
jgi:hypothetical protein